MLHSIPKHPLYITKVKDWDKWRVSYEAGDCFKDRYLVRHSNREDNSDFCERKDMSYVPSFAKAAINDVKNSIYQRMIDIVRVGGDESYNDAVAGKAGGVDLRGSTMNSFIGCKVLPELLVTAKVGIFVDMPARTGITLANNVNRRPYLYIYPAEDIINWIQVGPNNQFQAVVLRDCSYKYDDKTGFPIGNQTTYRYMFVNEFGTVTAQILDDSYNIIDEAILDMPKIPFVCVELSQSLMEDICGHQIALLNLASSDVAFATKANFPFYTEQFDPTTELAHLLAPDLDGEEEASDTKNKEMIVGPTRGRRYSNTVTNPPSFIHPSSEPMQASMEKQEQLKHEIRLLLNLSITNLSPVRASADSKKTDDRSLESGLSYIGLELELAEREIAAIWSMYKNSSQIAKVSYPMDYSLKTPAERRAEAENILESVDKIPSLTLRREMAKCAVNILVGHKVTDDALKTIYREIDKAPNIVADSKQLILDVEKGIVSMETASKIRCYPSGDVEIAKIEHAERLARIAESQAAKNENAAARGIKDADPNPQSGKEEKSESRETDQDGQVTDKTRGEGK